MFELLQSCTFLLSLFSGNLLRCISGCYWALEIALRSILTCALASWTNSSCCVATCVCIYINSYRLVTRTERKLVFRVGCCVKQSYRRIRLSQLCSVANNFLKHQQFFWENKQAKLDWLPYTIPCICWLIKSVTCCSCLHCRLLCSFSVDVGFCRHSCAWSSRRFEREQDRCSYHG